MKEKNVNLTSAFNVDVSFNTFLNVSENVHLESEKYCNLRSGSEIVSETKTGNCFE